MKKYNIYCDESSIDNPSLQFMSIGALFIERESMPKIKEKIKKIQERYSVKGELKWKKTSLMSLNFYKKLFSYLFSLKTSKLSYKCIVVDKKSVNYEKYHNNDKELAFYKFYYQLLKNKLEENSRYYILLDFKPSKNTKAVKNIADYLSFSNQESEIKHIQEYPSKNNIFIQITDILTGAVAYSKNNIGKSAAKNKLTKIIATSINKKNLDFCSPLSEKKFNIFCIIPGKN